MKYRLIETISEANFAIIFKDNLMYINNDNQLIYNGDVIDEQIFQKNKNENFVFSILKKGGYHFYDGKTIIKSNYGAIVESCTNEILLGYSPFRKISGLLYETDIVILNKDTFDMERVLIPNYSNGILYYTDKYFIGGKKTSIRSYSIDSGALLWQYSLQDFGSYLYAGYKENYEVENIIGVRDNQLLVQISNNNLLVFDIADGTLLHRLELNDFIYQMSMQDSGYMILDNSNNRIVWLSRAVLIHISLDDFSVKLIRNFVNVPEDEKWTFRTSVLRDGKIYFTGNFKIEYYGACNVGVMDVETGEVLWQTRPYNATGLINFPLLSNDKMYIQDVDDVIYVFEEDPSLSCIDVLFPVEKKYTQFLDKLSSVKCPEDFKLVFKARKYSEYSIVEAYRNMFIEKKEDIFLALSPELRTQLGIFKSEDLSIEKSELLIGNIIKYK